MSQSPGIKQLEPSLRHKTVVSIQPVPGSPLDQVEIIVAMAKAAENSGAPALRIESVANVRAVAAAVSIPVIGIVKRDLDDSPVRITPFVEDVEQLAAAGASVIAFDATDRQRPESREAIAEAILHSGCIGMADCASFEDGLWAHQAGIELIGTTLSGYVGGPEPTEPDFDLVSRFAEQGFITMAEGRFNTPELAGKAIRTGATAVTVGSAITRLELVNNWFNQATLQAAEKAHAGAKV